MKPGEEFQVSSDDMMRPWVGHLVTVTHGDEPIKARVTGVAHGAVTLKVVPEDTRE